MVANMLYKLVFGLNYHYIYTIAVYGAVYVCVYVFVCVWTNE